MEIGEPIRTVEVEPIEAPVPAEEPAPAFDPVEPDRVEVPA